MRYFVKVFIFAVLNIFLFAGLSHAKVVTFEKEYTYQASEIDSKQIENLKKELETVKADTKKQKEYAKAADILSARDWFEKGYQYHMNKEYDKAIEAYTSAIALDTNNAVAYHNRGLAYYYDKGQYDRAIEDYNKAIALDPDYAATTCCLT
jgi:tetratricopeptide (TPR) repeat protein